jgi:hypothetical protein
LGLKKFYPLGVSVLSDMLTPAAMSIINKHIRISRGGFRVVGIRVKSTWFHIHMPHDST